MKGGWGKCLRRKRETGREKDRVNRRVGKMLKMTKRKKKSRKRVKYWAGEWEKRENTNRERKKER